MHISEYVYKTCLKELAINTGNPLKKILQPVTFLKILFILPSCHILKTSIFFRAPHNGHFWKICCITPIWTIYMVYWHIMVVPVNFSFWFNSYVNSQTSVELLIKCQNVLTKQKPEGTYNIDFHNYKKDCHLKYHMPGPNRKNTFSK